MKRLLSVTVLLSIIWFIPVWALATEYHALIDNQQKGPLTIEQLSGMSASGKITPETLVWTPGMAE
jgi:hypothetical protein